MMPQLTKLTPAQQQQQEELSAEFNRLRHDQRQVAGKLQELQADLSEHKLVLDTLNDVDEDRKCFRMVGGVLVERTVKEVKPALQNNSEKMKTLIGTLEKQLVEKGKDIANFIEKNNIQVKGSPASLGLPESVGKKSDEGDKKSASSSDKPTGVLVSESSASTAAAAEKAKA